jgi:nitrogen fixation protein NifU and related proteins
MNDELARLYQKVILEHNKSPRNYGPLPGATHEAQEHNPLCGDVITVRLNVANGVIDSVRFESRGCAIVRATGSLMTSAIAGKPIADALRLRDRFAAFLDDGNGAELGDLAVLAGVRDFRSRIACAMLPWRALLTALGERSG